MPGPPLQPQEGAFPRLYRQPLPARPAPPACCISRRGPCPRFMRVPNPRLLLSSRGGKCSRFVRRREPSTRPHQLLEGNMPTLLLHLQEGFSLVFPSNPGTGPHPVLPSSSRRRLSSRCFSNSKRGHAHASKGNHCSLPHVSRL